MFFLLGFFGYYLKYFSFSSIVQKIPYQQYPLVVLFHGLVSYFSIKYSLSLCSYLKKKAVLLIMGVILAFSCPFLFHFLPQNIVSGYALFIVSLIGTSFLQTYFISTFLNKDDTIPEPLFSTKILFFEEFGLLVSAFLNIQFGFGYYSIPIAIIFIILLYFSPRTEIKIKKEVKEELKSFYPFGETLVYLFIIFMLIKVTYGYIFYENLRAVESSGSNFMDVFAKFSMFEAIFSIALLAFKATGFFDTSWPRAFMGFFLLTFITMLFLVFDFNFYFGLIAVAISKIWQKVVLKDSAHNIFNSLPIKVRLFYWSESEKNSYIFSYPVIFILSSLVVFFSVNKIIIAIGMIVFSICGCFLLRKLINTITQFHVANMARSDSVGAYVSCLALKVLKSEEHKSALIAMLARTTDTRLKKALINILGQIQDEITIKTLMDHYHYSANENIQLAIVTSLVKFKSHKIDLFLLEALQKIINEQTSLGEIRRALFLRITLRLKDVAIPMILKILKDNPNDQRIIANALIVLGEIGLRRRDHDVFSQIAEYLNPQYSRRVRSNAILYLFQMKAYRNLAYSIFEEFLTSEEEYDKAAAAFLAGELELKGITPFIWENSVSSNHQNPTLLYSLLSLSLKGVEKRIVDFILTADKEQALFAINQLSSINNNHSRYMVYKEVLKLPMDSLVNFIDLLKKSGRDFDEDLRILEEEIESREL
jgi:hypothetical protein